MHYTKKLRLNGISEKDFRILKFLYIRKKSKVSPLAKELSLPRTTVAFRLNELKDRCLAEKIPVAGHEEWEVTTYAKELLLDATEREVFEATRYRTAESLKNIFEQILTDKSTERIYFIEPYGQTKSYMETIDSKDAVDVTRLFRRHKNISEGVSSDKLIELVKEYKTSVLKSMKGKMAIIYTVPDEYLKFEDMILVYKNTVYSINFDQEQVIEIKNAAFAHSIRSIVLALRSFGKKIDLNQYIKNILEERNFNQV